MKQLFLIIGCAMVLHNVQAQGNTIKIVDKMATQNGTSASIKAADLPSFHVALEKTTHIISPEPILYVDISSPKVEGNLPEKNIFRFKPDVTCKPGEQFQITIVTEQFVQVYKMTVGRDDTMETTVITINPEEALPTNSYNKIGKADFDRLSLLALTKKRKVHDLSSKKYGMKLFVSNIYVVGEFLLFDVGIHNKTNLSYDVDDIRFKLMDKKQVAAHVSQEIELKPVYQFYKSEATPITGKWRNFYLFRKFTYPGEKVFNIELTEKQLSGRKIALDVDYNSVLKAAFLL